MANKRFEYVVEGEERVNFKKLEDDDDFVYLRTKEWKGEGVHGNIDFYCLTSPRFYFELYSGAIVPIEATGEEGNEPEFLSKLENKLSMKIKRAL